jgi:hypothetical protein
VHELIAGVQRGEFDAVADSRESIENRWDELIAEYTLRVGRNRLAEPPAARKWRGYNMSRVKAMKRLERELEARPSGVKPATSLPGRGVVEKKLVDGSGRLEGIPDRVELDGGGGAHVVDIKTGFKTGDEISDDHRRQLLFYSYLWHANRGEYPSRASVETVEGEKTGFDVVPAEAEEVAAGALARLDDFDASDPGAPGFATPSDQACRHCDFRCCCDEYFESIPGSSDGGLPRYSRSLLGIVTGSRESNGKQVLELGEIRGHVEDGMDNAQVVGLPCDFEATTGDRVGFCDLKPGGYKSVYQVTWETRAWNWTSQPGQGLTF